METSPQFLHPSFTLNGLQYDTVEDLLRIAEELQEEGEDFEVSIGQFIQKWLNNKDSIKVKTSGSTGKPKKIKILKKNMINSAKATGAYFDLGEKTSALLCLSAEYIGGKMMLVRAMTLGWNLHVVAPVKDALTQYDNDYDFVAMVPYQLYHSLDDLKKVKKMIVGGGAVSEELIEQIKDVPTEVFATYGMTETISHIAVKRLNGPNKSDRYTALPNVNFTTDGRECLAIYAPDIIDDIVITNDLVDLKSDTEFVWLGRYDNVINSGGVKIHPEKVEAKLNTFISLPFIIASEEDEQLGQRVILIIETDQKKTLPNYSEAFTFLENYERPKKIYTLSKFPYTKTEKIKRGDILEVLKKYK
ncbi:AMP-binding protein [Ulvibacter litoralis]|uniref:O-succinylbenzoic acid--CoA ligase n=1 Tax=Ulvibacter litoralis TaxID=227084 RepID=A0A1G7I4P8_9FLAO|nr:AMP-binding protein [Ulvibacter litoralis]GHC62599.1 O-succinylbenzoic acid--CoA ligase [Ulvibacter litoralis]SDF07309.1 O-succinylbenzoic acid--CoA ligase [Ulvibacter litoralis]